MNLSTTSSSGVSSIASSKTTAASSITSSAAKISAPARTASYGVGWTVDLDGAPVYLNAYDREEGRVLSSVTVTFSIEPPSSETRLTARSWVRGRLNSWFWSFMRIERASGWPIQIGRAVLVLDLEDDYRAGGKEVEVDPVYGHSGEAVGAH